MHARKNKGKGFLDAPCGRIEKTLPKGSPIEEESVVHAAAPSPPTSELRIRVKHRKNHTQKESHRRGKNESKSVFVNTDSGPALANHVDPETHPSSSLPGKSPDVP